MNRVTFSVVAIMLLAAATTLPFVLNAGFGKAPQGAQLSQVEASPHYRDGQFHNQLPTPGFTGQKNMLAAWWDFLMTKRENARPAQPLPLRYWFVTLVIGVAMFLVVEIEKRLTRRFRKTA
ncbi:hypothetical protein AI2767V1_3637 [Klebsiella pneumoniae]|nr:hypothetical protein AI2767V1_3637 [Klebsiella pneumoniae]CAH6361708.1 hypothetical protein AI2767V1_3637 [Klebsiella pneumoniae]